MVQGTECFGVFVTRNTLLIATIINAAILLPSFIILCVGLATHCFEIHYNYSYDVNCNARTALIIAGGVSTGLCSLFLAGIIALWCKMRNAASTRTFMTTQPYTTYGTPTYGTPTVSTNTLQTAAHPAPYAVPNMGHPHYQQHPQLMPHAALPQAPMPQAPMPQAPVYQASMSLAPMSQTSMAQEPSASMSQAPMPQEPLPLKQSS